MYGLWNYRKILVVLCWILMVTHLTLVKVVLNHPVLRDDSHQWRWTIVFGNQCFMLLSLYLDCCARKKVIPVIEQEWEVMTWKCETSRLYCLDSGASENVLRVSGLCFWSIISDTLIVGDHIILTGPNFHSINLTRIFEGTGWCIFYLLFAAFWRSHVLVHMNMQARQNK